MLSKKLVKDIQSLSLKKRREEAGLFVAEGPKVVSELIEVIPQQLSQLFAVQSWADSHPELTDVQIVTQEELQRISFLHTPNSVLALFHRFAEEEPVAAGITLYLDTIQDPGNFGTIIRIADWFGLKQIVCSAGCADVYNPKVVQSTMASIARVKVYYDEDGNWLQQQNMNIYAATLGGEDVYKLPAVKDGILVIGNESKGISKEILQLAAKNISIPKKGTAESLNAAVATGIILSHLLR